MAFSCAIEMLTKEERDLPDGDPDTNQDGHESGIGQSTDAHYRHPNA
jgi:hypothetical protein